MAICQHQRDVERLVQLSLARPRSSTASVFSSKMLADEKMLACKAECGDASAFRDVEVHPIDAKAAAAELEPYDPIGDGIRTFCDAVERTWNRIRRRPSASGDHPGVTPAQG